MFNERKDSKDNVYLIYFNLLFDYKKETVSALCRGSEIKKCADLFNMKKYTYDNIYLSYMYEVEGNDDYRVLDNRIKQNIITYKNINEREIYNYPIIIFSKNLGTIATTEKELLDESCNGEVGE